MRGNKYLKRAISIILIAFLILTQTQLSNVIVYAANAVTTTNTKVDDAFLNLVIQDGAGNTIVDLKDEAAYKGWKLSPEVTYYLKARVNRPANKNFVALHVGKQNANGELEYTGLRIVSPPGGVTTVGPINHDAFDRLEAYKGIEDPTYGDKNTVFKLSDGELIYHIKDSIKQGTYFDFELGFAVDGVVYNDFETLEKALGVSILSTVDAAKDAQSISLDIPVSKRNELKTEFSKDTFNTILNKENVTSFKIWGNQVAFLYDYIEYDFEYPKDAVLSGMGFSASLEKTSPITGTMSVTDAGFNEAGDMRKVHIIIKDGYKAYASNLNTYYKMIFSKKKFSVGQKVPCNVKNVKIYLKGNSEPLTTTDATVTYNLISPTSDATTMTANAHKVYNQTADTSADYMVQLGNAYIQNQSEVTTPNEKILEVEYNQTNTAAEILAITIPKGTDDNPTLEVTGIAEDGSEKSVTIMGETLDVKTATSTSGYESSYYVVFGSKYGLRSIKKLKADIGYLTPNFTSSTWYLGEDIDHNLAAAYGRFTTAESGIVVTNSYHLYNKDPETRDLVNGDISMKTIVTSTLDHIVGMDSLSFNMYNKDKEVINSAPYIAAGDTVQIVGKVIPYTIPGAAYTPKDGSDNGKGVMLPDTTKKECATSIGMVDPVIYMFMPKGMNYKDLTFALIRTQTFDGVVETEKNVNLDYNIESVSYLNTTNDGVSIYKITFPKDTFIGCYDGDGRENVLTYNCTLSTSESMETKGYSFNDMFQFTTAKGIKGAVYAPSVGQINNTKADKYGINKGNYLLGINEGVTESAINLQEITEIQVQNAISVSKINGNEVADRTWLTYATLGGTDEADPNTITLLGKKSEGQVRLEITNRASEASGEVDIIMPIPQEGVDMGTMFMKEASQYDMNVTWDESNIPEGFTARYVMLKSQDEQSGFTYEELQDGEKGNAVLLHADSMKGKAILYAYLDYSVEGGEAGALNIFRTAHAYQAAGSVFTKVGSYVAAGIATGKISGIVFDDLNRNGIQSQDEKGLAGVKVVATSDQGDIQSTITDENGYYEFKAVREGNVTLSFMVDLNNEAHNAYRFNVPSNELTNAKDGLSTSIQLNSVESDTKVAAPMSKYFSVVYDGNGGNGDVPTTVECTENAEVIISTNPDNLVKLGYKFKEWNTKADGSGESYTPGSHIKVTQDVCGYDEEGVCTRELKLYAIWEMTEYTVTLNYRGGTPVVPCTSFTIQGGQQYSAAYREATGKVFPYYNQKLYFGQNAPVKNGYEFGGWTDGITSDQITVTYSTVFNRNENITLYAIWNPKKGFTVTYNTGEDGSKIADKTDVAWNEIVVPTLTDEEGNIQEPVRKGYVFDGWMYEGELIDEETVYSELAKDETVTSIELVAKWNEKTDYNVEYVPGEGVAEIDNKVVSWLSTDLFPSVVPTKEGYAFLGWASSEANAEEGILVESATYAQLAEFDDTVKTITLYGAWKKVEADIVVVSYDTDGGNMIADYVTRADQANLLPSTNPIKAGYEFIGWRYEEQSVTQETIYSDLAGDKTKITLKAVWQEKTYTISYDTNGGNEVYEDVVAKWSKTELLPETNPERDGYSFVGWYYNSNLVENTDSIATLSQKDAVIGNKLTLMAKWKPLNYTVEYDVAGGSYITPVTGLKYTSNGLVPKEDPVKVGYTFDGWTYTKEDGTVITVNLETKVSELAPKSTNIILHANYSIKTGFTVKYDTTGGTDIAPKTDVAWTDTNLIPEEIPTRIGYEFTGWVCGRTSVNTATSYSTIATTDQAGSFVTLVAQWKQKTCDIIYMEGDMPYDWKGVNHSTTYIYGVPQVLAYPLNETRTFNGWYRNPECTGEAVTALGEAELGDENGNIVLYASFTSVARLPYTTRGTGKEACNITVHNNNSGLKYVRYMYSGETPLTDYTWKDYVARGKEYSEVNGTVGYKCCTGTVTVNDNNEKVSTLDGKVITLTKAGWYNFLLTTADGEYVYVSYEVTVEKLDLPNTTREGNIVTVHNNNSGLKYVRYMYSGTEPLEQYSWKQFVAIGKENTSINGSRGYISEAGVVGEDASSTLDGKEIKLNKIGWYNILLTTSDGKEVYVSYEVTEIEGGRLDANGFKLTYTDELTGGKILGYSYKYMGEEEPETLEIDSYDTTKNIVVKRNEETKGRLEFVVPKAGWYIVEIRDENIGVQLFKIQVFKNASTNIEDKPILAIDNLTIQGIPVKEGTKIVFIGLKDGELVEGDRFNVDAYGIYEVELVDDTGKSYVLTADVDNNNLNQNIDTTKLIEALQVADRLYNSDYKIVDDIESQIEPGCYVRAEDREMLLNAINAAKEVYNKPESQEQVVNATSQLNDVINIYQEAVREIIAHLVNVQGRTITVLPEKETYRLQQVYYNADENRELTPDVWGDWAGLSRDKEYPYVKVDKFGDEDKLVFENRKNGVYTILINELCDGELKTVYDYAIVAVDEDETDDQVVTEGTVAKDTLTYYADYAQNKLNGWVKQSQAKPGQVYISDDHYNKLTECLRLAEEMTADNDPYEEIIPLTVRLRNYTRLAGNGVLMPIEPVEVEEATISVDDITATVTGNSVKRVYFSYGNHENWDSMKAAGYTRIIPKTIDGIKTAQYEALYNGTYTVAINYIDGTSVYHTFEIQSEQATNILDKEGNIVIELGSQFNVIDTVSEIYYGYGTDYTSISDQGLLKYAKQDTTYILPALGNGMHKLFIKMESGLIHEVSVEVKSCIEPQILLYDNHIGVFTNGFDIMSVSYAKGNYVNWESMYENAYYIGTNIWLSAEEFIPGEVYTFCFKDTNNVEYFKSIVVNEETDEPVVIIEQTLLAQVMEESNIPTEEVEQTPVAEEKEESNIPTEKVEQTPAAEEKEESNIPTEEVEQTPAAEEKEESNIPTEEVEQTSAAEEKEEGNIPTEEVEQAPAAEEKEESNISTEVVEQTSVGEISEESNVTVETEQNVQ